MAKKKKNSKSAINSNNKLNGQNDIGTVGGGDGGCDGGVDTSTNKNNNSNKNEQEEEGEEQVEEGGVQAVVLESLNDMETRHKKELKAFDGEKRSQIKKLKSTSGGGGNKKKLKELMDTLEKEYDTKLKDMEERHSKEKLDRISSEQKEKDATTTTTSTTTTTKEDEEDDDDDDDDDDDISNVRQRKLEKARRKREKQRQQEIQHRKQIDEEIRNAGPSLRQIEFEQIQKQLSSIQIIGNNNTDDDNNDNAINEDMKHSSLTQSTKSSNQSYKIHDIIADGHCLYRAIALWKYGTQESYGFIRNLCADTLEANRIEYEPFCEYTHAYPNFQQYVQQRIRTPSIEWGGHLELRLLSLALQTPIHIYSAPNTNTTTTNESTQQQPQPLIIESTTTTSTTTTNTNQPIIRLSYHLHYYALGEHYNLILPANT